uniref:synaptonemal complex protein 3-like isoform X1 n=1 Tax=Styela clava TaxID=7725 RepID=UPI001939FA76|nr:synaptonemal complex protein 3-like isoform X1 [Styela clava]
MNMVRTGQKKKVVKIENEQKVTEDDCGDNESRPRSSMTIPAAAVKRSYEEEDDSDQDCEEESPEYNIGNQMTSLIKKFGSDMKKNLSAKRKRLETLTSQSASNCRTKVDAIMDSQRKDRQTLDNEYTKQMNCLFTQWETDIAKVKENEDKLNNVLQQQMKLIAQIRVVQTQRFKSLKQLQEQYMNSTQDMESNHVLQKSNVCSDLKEEMSRLQTKILKDTQTQEMASMRQNFHTMLFK